MYYKTVIHGSATPLLRIPIFPNASFVTLPKAGNSLWIGVADVCPNQQLLIYRTTNREGYRQYHSDARLCRECPMLRQCTRSRNCTKIVTRHVWQDSKDRIDQHRLEPYGKRIYKRRKETVERSFADAKQLHGHRYARMRGLRRAAEQCLLAAAAQNMKKIALLLSRMIPNPGPNNADSSNIQLQQQFQFLSKTFGWLSTLQLLLIT